MNGPVRLSTDERDKNPQFCIAYPEKDGQWKYGLFSHRTLFTTNIVKNLTSYWEHCFNATPILCHEIAKTYSESK